MIDREKPARKRCNAKCRSGNLCRNFAVPGRDRCKRHGGKTPLAGPEHPKFKSGKTSKILPGRLNDIYLQALNDPELLSHRKYAALLDTRVRQLCDRLFTKESGGLWGKLRDQWQQLEDSQNAMKRAADEARELRESAKLAEDDQERATLLRSAVAADERRAGAARQFGALLKQVGETITKGASEEALWKELTAAADEASVMKMRETKRLEAERMMVPIMEVMTLVAAIHASCREVCESLLPPDKTKLVLQQMGGKLQRLMGPPNTNREEYEKRHTVDGEVVKGVSDAETGLQDSGPADAESSSTAIS